MTTAHTHYGRTMADIPDDPTGYLRNHFDHWARRTTAEPRPIPDTWDELDVETFWHWCAERFDRTPINTSWPELLQTYQQQTEDHTP